MQDSAAIGEARRCETAEKLNVPVEALPRNLAIIMDGNGRWAQARSRPRIDGHIQGAATAEKLSLDCAHMGLLAHALFIKHRKLAAPGRRGFRLDEAL